MIRRAIRSLAIDTEATGLRAYIGKDLPSDHRTDKAFVVTACDTEGNIYYWEFPVDPTTREPLYQENLETVKDIHDTIYSYDEWVFHNANYDLRILTILFRNTPYKFHYLDRPVHDTQLESHIIDSKASHGLKDLGKRYFNIDNDDERRLQQAVVDARRMARSMGLATKWAMSDNTYEDYWIPKAVYLYRKTYTPPTIYNKKTKKETQVHLEEAPEYWNTVCEDYATNDAELTIALHILFQEILSQRKLIDLYNKERELIPEILLLHSQGMHFFYSKAKAVVDDIDESINEITERLVHIATPYMRDFFVSKKKHAVFNPNSDVQLCELLFNQLGLPVFDEHLTDKGKPSTDADTIHTLLKFLSGDVTYEEKAKQEVASQFLNELLELKLEQTTSRYIRNYLQHAQCIRVGTQGHRYLNFLYPNLNQTGTGTTRFSSSNPNGQNISKGTEEEDEDGKKVKRFNLRELFGPRPGHKWITIDYKSLQLIIFAYESGDQGMIDAFLQGYDFHNYVACGLFNTKTPTDIQRRIAKNVNYALIFGAGSAKVDATAGMKGAHALYYTQFPIVGEYMEKVIRQVRKTGMVTTAFGYPLVVPQSQPYKGVNYIVQGDEGNIVKYAMIECNRYLRSIKSPANLIMQIHDELIFECPIGYDFPIKQITDLMMLPAKQIGWVTPVDASVIYDHWGSKTSLAV